MKTLLLATAFAVLITTANAQTAVPMRDIANFETLNHQCYYGPPDQPEEDMNKACAAVDALVKKLNAKGYCTYGHGVVGRYSRDKKHCYELKALR